jgi:hypothetical protein
MRVLFLLVAPPVVAARAGAQERVFPHVTSFELPQASPRVHGIVGRLISVRRGESDFAP